MIRRALKKRSLFPAENSLNRPLLNSLGLIEGQTAAEPHLFAYELAVSMNNKDQYFAALAEDANLAIADHPVGGI